MALNQALARTLVEPDAVELDKIEVEEGGEAMEAARVEAEARERQGKLFQGLRFFSGGSMFNLSGSLTRLTGGSDAVRPNMPWERPCRLTCRPSSLRGGWATMFHQSKRNLKKGSKMAVSKRKKKRRKTMEKRKKATGRRLTVMKV